MPAKKLDWQELAQASILVGASAQLLTTALEIADRMVARSEAPSIGAAMQIVHSEMALAAEKIRAIQQQGES